MSKTLKQDLPPLLADALSDFQSAIRKVNQVAETAIPLGSLVIDGKTRKHGRVIGYSKNTGLATPGVMFVDTFDKQQRFVPITHIVRVHPPKNGDFA